MSVQEHLSRVDELLAHVERSLSATWAEVNRDLDDAFVLGDVPPLLARLTRPGGKRLRPTMSYIGWRAAGAGTGYGDLLHAGAGLDLLHAFALTHDDVMDRSPVRRGRPAVHVEAADAHRALDGAGDAGRFGDSVAVLLGDLIFAEATAVTTCLPGPMRAVWHAMLVELVAGQLGDLSGTAQRRRDAPHALAVARAKSGAYSIQRPLELGCLAAHGRTETRAALVTYGRNVGEAFALRDDLLGAFGDPEVTGKPVGEDLRAGKTTLLLSFATTMLDGTAARLLDRATTTGLDDAGLVDLQDALRTCGVEDRVEKLVHERVGAALDALDPDAVDDQALPDLRDMAEQIAWRTS